VKVKDASPGRCPIDDCPADKVGARDEDGVGIQFIEKIKGFGIVYVLDTDLGDRRKTRILLRILPLKPPPCLKERSSHYSTESPVHQEPHSTSR
jgi:hypothetical protein